MSRPADLQGPRGRAWVLTPSPEAPACLGLFLVHAPGFHPMWSWYVLSVVHLRPVEGVPAPTLLFPGAEFEVVVQALDPAPDPEHYVEVEPVTPLPVRPLRPANIVEQFAGVDDSAAFGVLQRLTMAVVRGQLSPDTDFRRAWSTAVALLVRKIRTSAVAEA